MSATNKNVITNVIAKYLSQSPENKHLPVCIFSNASKAPRNVKKTPIALLTKETINSVKSLAERVQNKLEFHASERSKAPPLAPPLI
jgi:hypothetical protein